MLSGTEYDTPFRVGFRKTFPLLLPTAVVALAIIGLWQLAAKPSSQLMGNIAVGEVLKGGSVGQSLVITGDGLYRIDVLLATYARLNQGPVIFHVKTSPAAGEDLVAVIFEAAEVRDNTFRAFQFKPLSLPVGTPLYFELEAPEATPGNALTIWGTRDDAFGDGEAVFHNLPNANGVKELAFKVYYQPDLLDVVWQLPGRLMAHRPPPFGQPAVLVALGFLYLILLFRLGSAFGLLSDPGAWQESNSP